MPLGSAFSLYDGPASRLPPAFLSLSHIHSLAHSLSHTLFLPPLSIYAPATAAIFLAPILPLQENRPRFSVQWDLVRVGSKVYRWAFLRPFLASTASSHSMLRYFVARIQLLLPWFRLESLPAENSEEDPRILRLWKEDTKWDNAFSFCIHRVLSNKPIGKSTNTLLFSFYALKCLITGCLQVEPLQIYAEVKKRFWATPLPSQDKYSHHNYSLIQLIGANWWVTPEELDAGRGEQKGSKALTSLSLCFIPLRKALPAKEYWFIVFKEIEGMTRQTIDTAPQLALLNIYIGYN